MPGEATAIRVRPDVTETVMNYLQARGTELTEREAKESATARLPLSIGSGQPVNVTPAGLIIGHRRVSPSVRRLHHLLRASAVPAAALTYLADQGAVRAAHSRGYDPVLYRAYRDIFPPRSKHADGATALYPDGDQDSSGWWYADLVVYSPGRLPGGEPFRSTGHWNAPAQLEIFQTLTGRTLMLVAIRSTDDRLQVGHQVCEAGEIAVVPPGAWHLTYCLAGPAAVLNIYTDTPLLSTGHFSRQAALDDELKYRTQPPAAITARCTAGVVHLVGADDAVRTPRTLVTPPWMFDHVPSGGSLGGLYLNATANALADLEHAAADSGGDHG
jgi:hypothetical protein